MNGVRHEVYPQTSPEAAQMVLYGVLEFMYHECSVVM